LDGEAGRLDSATSTLAADIGTSDTSISVATSNSADLWTTDSTQFPFTVVVDGETWTVTAISGASSPQTFTVTRSANTVVKTHTAGAAVHLYHAAALAL
jgi:hypothetical protein